MILKGKHRNYWNQFFQYFDKNSSFLKTCPKYVYYAQKKLFVWFHRTWELTMQTFWRGCLVYLLGLIILLMYFNDFHFMHISWGILMYVRLCHFMEKIYPKPDSSTSKSLHGESVMSLTCYEGKWNDPHSATWRAPCAATAHFELGVTSTYARS